MSIGGDIDYATTLENAADQYATVLKHLVKVLTDPSLSTLDQDRFIGVMQNLEQTRNQIPLIDHALIGEAESRNLPEALTQPSMIRVLMSVLRLSPGEASRRVRAAAAVGERTSMLGQPLPPLRPHLAAAQQAGRVSPEQVSIIERALAQVDRRGFDPADIDKGEQLLVGFADIHSVTELRILAAQVIDRIDPDGTHPKTSSTTTAAMSSSTAAGTDPGPARCGSPVPSEPNCRPCSDPWRSRGSTLVNGPDGRLIEEPDLRHHGQRMHDALEDVCDRLLRTDTIPESGGTPATVIVTIDLDDLLARTGYGTSSDGTLIPTDQVLRMANQADIIPAVLTRTGAVLDLGRTRRIASPSQTLALYARDAGCSFPGCDRAPEWCERHHIIPWIEGGETNVNNLTLLCRYHHHNFTSRGWTGRINSDGIPEWTPPRSVDRDQKLIINTRITAMHAARMNRRN